MGVIIVGGSVNYDKNEILDVKWFTYDEIINMNDELRSYDWITHAITAVENNKIDRYNKSYKVSSKK